MSLSPSLSHALSITNQNSRFSQYISQYIKTFSHRYSSIFRFKSGFDAKSQYRTGHNIIFKSKWSKINSKPVFSIGTFLIDVWYQSLVSKQGPSNKEKVTKRNSRADTMHIPDMNWAERFWLIKNKKMLFEKP